MSSWARFRLPLAAVIIFAIGVGLNYVVSSRGIFFPAAWLWPLLVTLLFGMVIWAIGGMFLIKRVWFWLWGAPWDAAGYIAGKPKTPKDPED
jgi:hypothetical protein